MMSSDEPQPFAGLSSPGQLKLQTDEDVQERGHVDDDVIVTSSIALNSHTSPTTSQGQGVGMRSFSANNDESPLQSPSGDSFRAPRFNSSSVCGRTNYDMAEIQQKLDSLKKWSYSTYKCTKQAALEHMGKIDRTVDVELERQITSLRDTQREYGKLLAATRGFTSHLQQMTDMQIRVADQFAHLSDHDTITLRDPFHQNTLAQRAIVQNAQKLIAAMHFFNGALQTLVEKTIEDTIITIRTFDQSRLEYDSYRHDLTVLQQQPSGSVDLQGKIHLTEVRCQELKKKYENLRDDVQVKIQFLEENRVKVMEKHLMLFHNSVAAYFSGNQEALDEALKEFNVKVYHKPPPSFLEQ